MATTPAVGSRVPVGVSGEPSRTKLPQGHRGNCTRIDLHDREADREGLRMSLEPQLRNSCRFADRDLLDAARPAAYPSTHTLQQPRTGDAAWPTPPHRSPAS